jgi:hypothetical protein
MVSMRYPLETNEADPQLRDKEHAMTALMLQVDLDDPFDAQELTTTLAATLRQNGYTVQPAQLPPDEIQSMGGSLLEVAQQTGQHVLENKEFYSAWFVAITTIVKSLHARHQARVKVQQAERTATLTTDTAANETLLRELILEDAPVTVTVTDKE